MNELDRIKELAKANLTEGWKSIAWSNKISLEQNTLDGDTSEYYIFVYSNGSNDRQSKEQIYLGKDYNEAVKYYRFAVKLIDAL